MKSNSMAGFFSNKQYAAMAESASKNMFKNFVLIMSLASSLTMLNNRMFDSTAFRLGIYALMVIYVIWVVRYTYKRVPQLYNNKKVIFLCLLLLVNMLASPYDPMYSRLIKYLGYIGSFAFGYVVYEQSISIKCNKWLMGSLILLPLFFVTFFDQTPHKILFFPLSNAYSFLGLCCALFLYTIYNDKKYILFWSICLVFAYIMSASTLGIVTAFMLAVLIINRRNTKLMLASVVIGIVGFLSVMYIDIPVFLRIRDVFDLASSLSWYEWTHLKDMNFYEVSSAINMQSDRNDNASFLWRLAHWQFILNGVFENWWYALLFGLGEGYANKEIGYNCHNEFIKFFAENGAIVFFILMSWILKVNRYLQDKQVYYLILTVICYHLTENLIDAFIACVLFYFCLGYWIKRTEIERQSYHCKRSVNADFPH